MNDEDENEDLECICSHPESSHDERGCGQFINDFEGDCLCEKFNAL